MDLEALKTELTADPLGRGYSTMNDVEAAVNLNTVRDRTSDSPSITGGMIASAVVFSEFAALAANNKQYVAALMASGDMPVTAALKQSLAASFGAGTTTRQNLIALVPRASTRAEELNLGRVTESDIADARRL